VKTTVTTIAAAKQALRMAAPVADVVAGARLLRVPGANAPRATRIARPGRTLRSFDFGHVGNISGLKNFTQAEADVIGNGVSLVSGATHVWDIPGGSEEIILSGNGAVRVSFLARNGSPLVDTESGVAGQLAMNVPANAAMAAVTCLGAVDASAAKVSGFGAICLTHAPQGSTPVVGWQIGNHAPQISGRALLTRGSSLLLSTHYVASHGKQKTSDALAQISYALADQVGSETRLPTQIETILILLDRQGGDEASAGDLAIGVTGATVHTPPLLVVGGNRSGLLYDITSHDGKAVSISVAVGSLTGWALAGVAGMQGSAQSWAVMWNGKVPEHVVPDGALTPDGVLTVHITQSQGVLQ